MNWRHGSGHAVVGHQRDLAALRLGQFSISDQHAEGSVLHCPFKTRGLFQAQQIRSCIEETLIFTTSARKDAPIFVQDIPAIGDVLNEDGSILAGARSEDQSFLNTRSYLLGLKESPRFERAMEHTTLCVLVTDAELTKTECRQVALVAHDGMARAVSPVHTPMDGDTVFVLSAGDRSSNVFQLGAAAVDSTAASIRRAVRTADSVGGVPGLASIQSPTQSP